jgi:outer membrane protein assembly factor BamB
MTHQTRRNSSLRRNLIACLAVAVLMIGARSTLADVFSGTIVSVSGNTGRIVVKSTTKGINRSFQLSSRARISLDGKSSFLSRIKPGQTVSVFASGTRATRLIVRTPKDGSTSPAGKIGTAGTSKTKPSGSTTKKTTRPPRTPGRSTTTPLSTASAESGTGTVWNQYRGPNRDNKSLDRGLLTSWGPQGPPPAWMATGLGDGYSSISLAHGKVYTMGSIGRDEMVIAVDASNGKQAWATRNGSTRQDGAGNGPRGTPTVDGDRVFALGANGDLSCLDAHTGQSVWRKNILSEFGGRNIQWGISESVLIDGEKLICTPGGSRGTMVALDKATGRTIWTSNVPGSPRAAYSSPIVFEVGGVRQYATFVQNGVVGIRARDGQPMWGQRESANGTANCSSPVFFNNTVFSASGYGTGGALFRLNSRGGTTSSQVGWSTRKMKNHHGGMVEIDGFLYGCDEQVLTCLNLRSGDVAWQSRSVGKGAVTFADGHLYVRSEQGPVALVEASSQSYVEKGRFDQPQRSNRQSWAHPVVADGKLFLRDQDRLLVYNVKAD